MEINPEQTSEEKIKSLSEHVARQLSFINSYTATNIRLTRTIDGLESRINHQTRLIEWLSIFVSDERLLPIKEMEDRYEVKIRFLEAELATLKHKSNNEDALNKKPEL